MVVRMLLGIRRFRLESGPKGTGSSMTTRSTPHSTEQKTRQFSFLGGDPSIDFVNTVDEMLGDSPIDQLESYGDLLDWSEQASLICTDIIASLQEAAQECERDSERVLRQARLFRSHLRDVLTSFVEDRPPEARDLKAITAYARKAAAHSRLDCCGDGFAWVLDEASGCELDWPIWELARAAVALLTSDSLNRLRRCANETCGWLFIDQSRNHSRRWCDMSSCGNRAKARRNYARQTAKRKTKQG